MITRVEATNYRCFELLGIELDDFCVIAGANGSGKTTMLDIPVLIGDLVRGRDVAQAFLGNGMNRGPRAGTLSELTFADQETCFGFGVEARLPDGIKRDPYTHIRYELQLVVEEKRRIVVHSEYLFLIPEDGAKDSSENGKGERRCFIIRRDHGQESFFYPRREEPSRNMARIDAIRTALARLSFDSEAAYPEGRWFLEYLLNEVIFFDPEWRGLRKASPPGLPERLMASGENLPWLALALQREHPTRFEAWLAHVRTALPQITGIEVKEREEDHHAYFRVRYEGGFEVTSSGLSEGTLRILALTLPAYLDLGPGLLVVEEPENSIHPQAIYTVMQSLSSVYDRQVLVSTHSPVVLAARQVSELLITQMARSGASQVVPGNEHPRLVGWKGAIDLGSLFAAGVLE